jgi:quinoprotein glucose dehydrogenase
MSWRRFSGIILLGTACTTGSPEAIDPGSRPIAGDEWAVYGRDPGGTRFSPAAQITRDNVGTLRLAWTYTTGETRPQFASRRPKAFEATPLVVDGTMYLSTPLGRVIALDPVTGAERWVFDPRPPVDRREAWSDFANRGVSTWLDPTAAAGAVCRRRIIVGTIDARLIAVDAGSGTPCAGFGDDGSINLRIGLRIAPRSVGSYQVTSPPAVVNDVIVTGSAIGDNSYLATASGEVRGYDARTGALLWTWDPIPQDSTDPGFATWSDPRGGRVAAANAWSVLVADPARDLVFVPTSSASPDYYGAERLGANVYANSVVALRASTGRVVWHFQTVHHDLWDYDNAAPPALVTVQRDGREIPAVLQATKTGMLFVLHRETGEPLFPVEERPVPRSTVPGEEAWPTQPFSAIRLSPLAVEVDSAWGPSPEDRAACRSVISGLRNEGIFTPPSEQGTLVIPSNIGGAHWGGVAVDERRQVAVVPVNRIAAMVQLLPRGPYDSGAAQSGGFEYNPMRGTPYWMRRRFLLGPSGLPCTPPPFGSLLAVDLRTGGILWNVPLGEMSRDLPAALRAQHPGGLGSVHLGGPVVTAGGIVFIGATLDRALRAYDIETGRELWRADLPAGARATPMTYVAGGQQFVVIAAGGGGLFGEGDAVLAFALPPGN